MTNRTITPKRTQTKHICPHGEPCCLDHEPLAQITHTLCICNNPGCPCHGQPRYNDSLPVLGRAEEGSTTRRRALALLLGLGGAALLGALPANAQTCQSRRTRPCADPTNPNRRTRNGRTITYRRRPQ